MSNYIKVWFVKPSLWSTECFIAKAVSSQGKMVAQNDPNAMS